MQSTAYSFIYDHHYLIIEYYQDPRKRTLPSLAIYPIPYKSQCLLYTSMKLAVQDILINGVM
jgi:hypothetical protein